MDREKYPYPEIGYQRAMCMTQLHRANGSKRLDDACKRALGGGATSQRHNKNNLEKVQDRGAERDLYGT